MFKISKASHKETDPFNEVTWHAEDIAHYGHPVEWQEKDFRFKAEESGKIIGTISGKHESGVLYIGAIIVDETARNKGVGRALIARVEQFGKKLGAHKIWLTTGKDWKAGKFYEKIGFGKTADLANHHFHHDFVIYTKFI